MSGTVPLPAIFGEDRFADLDLGERHWLSFYIVSGPRDGPDVPGQLPELAPEHVGGIIYHIKQNGEPCWGSIQWLHVPEGRPKWQRLSHPDDDFAALTLSPSILCKLCEDHGFIREGRWVRV